VRAGVPTAPSLALDVRLSGRGPFGSRTILRVGPPPFFSSLQCTVKNAPEHAVPASNPLPPGQSLQGCESKHLLIGQSGLGRARCKPPLSFHDLRQFTGFFPYEAGLDATVYVTSLFPSQQTRGKVSCCPAPPATIRSGSDEQVRSRPTDRGLSRGPAVPFPRQAPASAFFFGFFGGFLRVVFFFFGFEFFGGGGFFFFVFFIFFIFFFGFSFFSFFWGFVFGVGWEPSFFLILRGLFFPDSSPNFLFRCTAGHGPRSPFFSSWPGSVGRCMSFFFG